MTRSGPRTRLDVMNQDLSRDDLHAALGVRREMGVEIEPALVDSLAAKVEATVQRRYQAELAALAGAVAVLVAGGAQRVAGRHLGARRRRLPASGVPQPQPGASAT